MNKLLTALIGIMLVILCVSVGYRVFNKTENTEEVINKEPEIQATIEPTQSTEPTVAPVETSLPTSTPVVEANDDRFTNTDSLLILVNKTHPISETYEPKDLVKPNVKSNKTGLSLRKEAAEALETMFNAALNDNITLVLGSSYRSYNYQQTLFTNYSKRDGEEAANKYSARAGTSEHQTGLACDISDAAGAHYLKQSFKDTAEGMWLKDNAHRFGFILRFPLGKEDITGYMFEPWHFRYVGVEEAQKIVDSGLTLEEFYNFTN